MPPQQSAIDNLKSKINNLFLIGYRGTGKSTIARLLGERLRWTAVDADALLEERQSKSIQQIFAEEGEAGFRTKEAALLEELCQGERQVIATGGGVILRPENRARLRDAGTCVWLTADADTIWQRLQADPTTAGRRPNLTVGGHAEIVDLLRQREPLYRACADLCIDTVGHSPESIADDILRPLPPDS